jgi:chemotaxis protein CheC
MGIEPGDLHSPPPMAASALREMGNILASTYLTAVSRLLRRSLIPSVPGLAMDMAGAVVDLLLMDVAGASDRATVLETTFREKAGPVRGRFFLLPDPGSLPLLMGRVRELPG